MEGGSIVALVERRVQLQQEAQTLAARLTAQLVRLEWQAHRVEPSWRSAKLGREVIAQQFGGFIGRPRKTERYLLSELLVAYL